MALSPITKTPRQAPKRGRWRVARLHGSLALKSLKLPLNVLGVLRDLPLLGLRGPGPQYRDHQLPLAIIDRNVSGIFLHDRPPFACGTVPGLEQPTAVQ